MSEKKEYNFNVTFYLNNGTVLLKNTVLEKSKVDEFRQALIKTFVDNKNQWFLFKDSADDDDQSLIKISDVSAIEFETYECRINNE